MTQNIFDALRAEFPQGHVHWRGQTTTQDGKKALALAYVDARDVMERLDNVVGPNHWQDDYEVNGSRTLCRLSIRVDGEWITKTDGAGDTAYEAEKGSISDAFKRAAVKFGVARYLYDLPTPWVPCECFTKQGKYVFKRFTDDPWKYVKRQSSQQPSQAEANASQQDEDIADFFCRKLDEAAKSGGLEDVKAVWAIAYKRRKEMTKEQYQRVEAVKDECKRSLEKEAA